MKKGRFENGSFGDLRLSSVSTEDMSSLAREDMSSLAREDMKSAKIVKIYEKMSKMGLESTVLDETRGK